MEHVKRASDQSDPESVSTAHEAVRRALSAAAKLSISERGDRPTPPPTPDEVRTRIDLGLPTSGLGAEEALRKLDLVAELTPKTSSPRFFNQLFAGREPMATTGEIVTALLNSSMYTYKAAGVQALIETEVVSRLCQLSGWADGEGTFVPGGSLGNLVGMALAAYQARPSLRDDGLSGPRLRFYLSEEGHYSVRKNAGLLGLGRGSVRRVGTDSSLRMRPDLLVERIEEDIACGHQPACVVATAGTTVAGVFDPIDQIAEVAGSFGLWLHVDGAFGGSYLLHPEQRSRLAGVERADSLTWNPHKMMGIPLPCAAVLVRRRGLLRKHFNEAADYLFQQDDEDLNLGTKSIQCGRRNDAFKLWLAWQELGDDGWRRRIDRQLVLTRHARDRVLATDGFELVLEPELPTVCFEVEGWPSDLICEQLGRSGQAQVGYGVIRGRKVIRLVLVNPILTTDQIDRFFDAISDLCARPSERVTLADQLGRSR